MEGNKKDEVEELTSGVADMSTSERPKVDVSKSTLSANAPVFVPRSFTQQPAAPAQYQDHQHSQHYNYEEEDEYVESEPQYRFHGTALDRIKQAETTLIANPGSFDDIMKPITDALKTAISNEKTLVSVTEEIFKQCVSEANFRYTGARLCNHLSQNLSLSFPGGDFRQQLLKRCHEEHLKRDQLASDPSQREHLQGFMLFMAELLLNMTSLLTSHVFKQGPDGNRIPILSTAVKEIIISLLNHPTDSSLKAIVQVLKLSGQYLEPEVDGAQGEAARPLDEVFAKIDAILQEETLNTSVRNMLGSVITLRSKDWGRKDSGLNGSGVNNPYAANNPYAQPNPYLDQGSGGGGGYHGGSGGQMYGGPPHMDGGPPQHYSTNYPDQYTTPYHINNGGSGAYCYPDQGDLFWQSSPSPHNIGQGDAGNGFEHHPQMPGQGEELDDEMASAFEEFLLETGQIDGQ